MNVWLLRSLPSEEVARHLLRAQTDAVPKTLPSVRHNEEQTVSTKTVVQCVVLARHCQREPFTNGLP
jgi:hypothetical protein